MSWDCFIPHKNYRTEYYSIDSLAFKCGHSATTNLICWYLMPMRGTSQTWVEKLESTGARREVWSRMKRENAAPDALDKKRCSKNALWRRDRTCVLLGCRLSLRVRKRWEKILKLPGKKDELVRTQRAHARAWEKRYSHVPGRKGYWYY